ncbi:hypothetical protein Nepgr_027658 [Nepenthes gracilis]|uniref:FAD-dependent oxidoreductase domain-containing protein 1 n=1 Tax=Nepenthes gracilis TaxID=150966 RepID=A0AAD3Y362_NEPGR|nr:hypothetical protein Nepgr_027658 [Nepenthes gracilis]
MAAISTLVLNPSYDCNELVNHHCSSLFVSQKSFSPLTVKRRNHRFQKASGGRSVIPVSASYSFDVVVIGAGIIGLSIARRFLLHSDLSVAVVDASVPCSGATGAGQGYLWMVHKTPGNDVWDLSIRSQKLWQMWADDIQDQGIDPLKVLGWKKTGSLLIGRTTKESDELKKRVQQLSAAGIRAEYLSYGDLHWEEPELAVGTEGSAAFSPDDCQLDAHRTVAFIEEGNRLFASHGRYTEFYHDPAVCFLRSSRKGNVEGVKTKKNSLYGKKAIVVAAGCWTGLLMRELLGESDIIVDVPVQPRKGFLLVLEKFNSLKLNHGLMEADYVNHENFVSASDAFDHDQSLSISMTATIDASGNLLIGSSRQLAGFNIELNKQIVDRIWEHAAQFFPALKELSLASFREQRKVRIGLRPYMPDGKPVIGPIPGMPNVFLATGHEGGGLSMALGTAEMVADMVLEQPLKVDHKPFAVEGRCCR